MSTEKGKGKRVNRTEMAAIFGVAMTTIDSWVRQGCPVLKRGTGRGNPNVFNTADVAQWLREKSVMEATGDKVADEAELKRRRLVADTELAELNLAKAKAEVIPIDQAERLVSRAFAEVRASMRNIPGRAVSQLIGETDERRFKSVLLEEIDQALSALADTDLAGDDEEDQSEEAA